MRKRAVSVEWNGLRDLGAMCSNVLNGVAAGRLNDESDPDGRGCRLLNQLVEEYLENAVTIRIERYLLVFMGILLAEVGVTSMAKSCILADRPSFRSCRALLSLVGMGSLSNLRPKRI